MIAINLIWLHAPLVHPFFHFHQNNEPEDQVQTVYCAKRVLFIKVMACWRDAYTVIPSSKPSSRRASRRQSTAMKSDNNLSYCQQKYYHRSGLFSCCSGNANLRIISTKDTASLHTLKMTAFF